jgi:predicted nucleic acid-binding protein
MTQKTESHPAEDSYKEADKRKLFAQFPAIELRPVLDFLAANAKVIEAPALPDYECTDSDDDKFLDCAVAGKVKLICSGDKSLLRASGYRVSQEHLLIGF